MRLEIAAVVKKIYSFGQEVGHLEAAKLLRVMEKTTKWSVGKPASIRYRQISHNGISLPAVTRQSFLAKACPDSMILRGSGQPRVWDLEFHTSWFREQLLDSAIPRKEEKCSQLHSATDVAV